jgi:hypothetical protein
MVNVQEFTARGVTHRLRHAQAEHRFFVGCDLGQSNDPTAISVLHRSREPLRSWSTILETDNLIEKHQDVAERFDVRHLERLPLGTSYPAVVELVARLIAREPLRENCELVIDETGVGRAVGDIFCRYGVEFVGVTITAGTGAERQQPSGPERWHVSKQVLVSTVDARLHTGELRFAADLAEAGAMAEELKDFRRHVSSAGRFSYEARSGKHDDLVLAVAIALWRATGARNTWTSEPIPF